jgi:hypothetical protein
MKKIYEVEGHYLTPRGEAVEIESITRERAIEIGIIVKVETYAQRKTRELREGLEGFSIGALEEHMQLLSKFSPEYKVAASVLEKKINDYDREQQEMTDEANEAAAKGLDATRVPAPSSEPANLSTLSAGRALLGRQ